MQDSITGVTLRKRSAIVLVTRHKTIILFGACLIWLGAFYLQTWHNPRIPFLVPSGDADWILHPEHKDLKLHLGTFSDEVIFRRRFALSRLPEKAEARLRAMTESKLWINGQALTADRGRGDRNWKRLERLTIRPYLRIGENTITVRVSNPTGVAALVFTASLDDVELRSGTSWQVSKKGRAGWASAAVAGTPAKPPSMAMIVLLVVFGLYLLAAATPRSVKERLGMAGLFASGEVPNHARTLSPQILIAAIFGGLGGLAFYNALNYPPLRGFDAKEHVEYIRYIALNWRFPLASEGWVMHHPPLFHTLAAVLYGLLTRDRAALWSPALRAVQLISAVSCVGSVVIAYLSLRRLYPGDDTMRLQGVGVAAFLPMNLYMMGMITNETFSAFTIALALYMLFKVGFDKGFSARHACILGLFNGLAMLAKFSGLFIVLTTGTILLMRLWKEPFERRRWLGYLVAFILSTVSICGWFYLRNTLEYGKPFVFNWDPITGQHFIHKPGYRTLDFYLRFGSAFAIEDLRDTRLISFSDGMYASLWADAHGRFVRTAAQWRLSRMILLLAALPTVALLLGFWRSVREALDPPYPNPSLALVLLTVLTFTGLVHHTLTLPFYSSIKAFFGLSLITPLALFAARGLRAMADNLGRFRPLLYAHLGLLYALIAMTFWYRE